MGDQRHRQTGRSLVEVFDSHAKALESHLAVCGGRNEGGPASLTWGELRLASLAIARQISADLAGEEVQLIAILIQRSPLWLAATVGVLRYGAAFIWMSPGELPMKSRHLEVSRNAQMAMALRPALVLVGGGIAQGLVPNADNGEPSLRTLTLTSADLLTQVVADMPVIVTDAAASATLCYMLTGGTTGASKCVTVAHAMAVHEVDAYPTIAPFLRAQDKVLQHTAVLWAASALGQIDLALSFGASSCVSNAADQESINSHGATVLGIVPSTLEVLEPHAVPSVRCVFTWGEALSRVVAQRWRGSGISVLELLISTEYWLSFVCDGLTSNVGRSIYQAVVGTEFGVLPAGDTQLRQDMGATGELCIRGPMVTFGYRSAADESKIESQASEHSSVAAWDGGLPFFRTNDVVTLIEGSSGKLCIEFGGRSDHLVKVAGQFVNLIAAEQQLTQILSKFPALVENNTAPEVAVIPRPPASASQSPSSPVAHVFIAVKRTDASAAESCAMLAATRAALPRGASLHFVKAPLPRDPVTGKVNRRDLLSGLEGVRPALPARPALQERLHTYPKWLLVMVLIAGVDLPTVVAVIWNMALPSGKPKALASAALKRMLLHVAGAPYLWLLTLHVQKRLMRRVTSYVPFGRLGLLAMIHHLDRYSSAHRRTRQGSAIGAASAAARGTLVAGTVIGAALAAYRGRLLAWWISFWVAIPDHLGNECGWWLRMGAWTWYLDQILGAIHSAPTRSFELMDWLYDVTAMLPGQVLTFYRESRATLRPYEPPAALRRDVRAVAPSTTFVWDLAEGRFGGSPPKAGAEGTDSTTTDKQAFLPPSPTTQSNPELETQCGSCAIATDHQSEFGMAGRDGSPEDTIEQEANQLDATDVAKQADPATLSLERASLEISPEADPRSGARWRCQQCRVELPWGADWRREDGHFFCKDCLKEYDDRWWEQQTRDVIDLHTTPSNYDVLRQDSPKSSAPAKPTNAAGARLLQLLEPHLGGFPPSSTTSLAGVDSLAVMSLCRALRMAMPNLTLRPLEVFECGTVGDLLSVVESMASGNSAPEAHAEERLHEDAEGQLAGARRPRAIWFAPGQYTGTCKWLYGCHGLLDEDVFRTAAARLIARHESLHAEVCDGTEVGLELVRFLKETLTLHVALRPEVDSMVARLPQRARSVVGPALGKVQRLVAWALKQSWPKSQQIRLTQEFLDERIKVFRCQSWREVDETSQRFRDEFTPPFIIALYLLEKPPYFCGIVDPAFRRTEEGSPHQWGAPTSFVQFIVSHAYSDGYTGVPLIQDLGALYANAEGRSAEQVPLAALPYGRSFDVLQERFFAAVDGEPKWAKPDQMSLRATCFDGPWAPRRHPWCYNHEVLLETGAVASLQQSAKNCGLPFDVALLSLVLASTFRAAAICGSHLVPASAGENAEAAAMADGSVMSLPLTLYAPLRDGDLNDAMVGLFSDWRDLTVACNGQTTLLGLCLDVADMIRNRRWVVFDPIQNSEHILVNILPLDEQPRGPRHFRQTRAHEYGNRRTSRSRERKAWKGPHRPMRITLEQEAPDAWWISLDINADRFSTSWCRSFVRCLRDCLSELAQKPLEPVVNAPLEVPLAGPRGPA